ncbi:MAG: C4-dicarboxylate ABC transporter permease [Alphaproteobacteria bacterium]|nr:MAG: C4-dicarboxylate ABC transporter permease [Alphaproteobacteria bacterium]
MFVRTALAAAAIAAAGIAAAETIPVTVVAGHPPVFRWVRMTHSVYIPAVNKALEGTGYSIEWSEQYGGSLAKVGGELEAVEEGLAEIGLVSSLFDPSKLAIQNVTYVTPFVSDKTATISAMMDKLQAEDADMRASWEANGLEYLGCAIGIDDYLLMTDFPVNSLADLQGKKIGAPGPAVNWLKGTGAVGVSGNLTTYYNELKTGVYDGVIVFASAALPGKLYEVAPFITKMRFGGQYAGGLAANKDWYDSQPPEVQAALKKGCEAYFTAYHQDLDAAVAKAFEVMQAKGATVREVDEAMRKAWADGMDNVAKLWAQALEEKGQPGMRLLKLYMQTMREAGATPVRNWDQE